MVSPSYRILMIESDSSFAATIRGMLQDRQNSAFQVAQAETLRAAAPMFAAENFDGVLLAAQALDSGGISGAVKVCPQIRSLPVIAMISEEVIGKRLVDGGATEFLVKKTLSPELLQRTLRYAIERSRTERALRQSEKRFQDLFENAKDILFTLDLEGNVTSLNKSAEEVMGWTKEEALSINLKSLVAPEHANLCNQFMQRILNEEPLQHFEISLLRKDGRKALLETSARLIYSDGQKQGIQGIARDVTERRQLEGMVRQSQKLEAIGRLSGGLAHDFNNLLCVINGHAELLSERLEETLPAATNVMQIKKAVDSASTLVRQLLAFSRKQVFHSQIVDLNAIVAETEKLLGRLIGEDIEFFTSLEPELGRVLVDPVQVEQVLVNLVLNARDAMPQGGKLTIETCNLDLEEGSPGSGGIAPAGKYVLLTVTDNGCGMDEETQSRIFEPFYTTKELGKGTGLGLATVHGIVKQSGGFIWVYSELGQGTTLKVYLPRVDDPAETLPSEETRKDVRRGTETVLLVENAEPLRALAKEFLKSNGYAVMEADNGKEALRIAKAFGGTIDLLLTDVIMPGMGGKQLAEQLTAVRPATKVLYMSGYLDDAVAQPGSPGTGTVFLEKPFTRETLLRRVRLALDQLPLTTAIPMRL
jgi:hypothetical protein